MILRAPLLFLALGLFACVPNEFRFLDPVRWGLLAPAGQPLEVVLSLPPAARVETLRFVDGNEAPVTVDAVEVEGSRARVTLSGLAEGRHVLRARVDLEPGRIANTCDGLCDGFTPAGAPNPDELDFGRQVPCDPLTEEAPDVGF